VIGENREHSPNDSSVRRGLQQFQPAAQLPKTFPGASNANAHLERADILECICR